MGREAVVLAEIGGEAGEVRALLESDTIILRGKMRRRFARTALDRVRVEGDTLCFTGAGEAVRLHLGARAAESWRLAIDTAPPSLRAKFGLDRGAVAWRVGGVGDAALDEALDGVTAPDIGAAAMIVAWVESAAGMDAVLGMHAARPTLPIWVVYRKGRGAAFGDSGIRTMLRGAGFKDTKSCEYPRR